MKVSIYTPINKLMDQGDVISVYAPGESGDFQILDDHIPFISSLKKGKIKIVTKDYKKIELQINYGYLQFSRNDLTIVIENTSLTSDELESIQKTAKEEKDQILRKDNSITEDEFENREKSLGK